MNTHLRKLSGLAAVVVLAVTVSGCSTSSPKVAAGKPSGSVASSSGVTAAPVGVGARVDPATFDPAAVAKFGKVEVEAANKFVADFTAKYGANTALANQTPAQVTMADLKDILPNMTPGAQRSLTSSMSKYSTEQARADVWGVSFTGINAGGYTLRTDVPGVADVTIANPHVGVVNDRMAVSQNFSATLRFKDAHGKNFKMTAAKKVTFWVVKGASGEHPFLIDGWRATFGGTGVEPDAS